MICLKANTEHTCLQTRPNSQKIHFWMRSQEKYPSLSIVEGFIDIQCFYQECHWNDSNESRQSFAKKIAKMSCSANPNPALQAKTGNHSESPLLFFKNTLKLYILHRHNFENNDNAIMIGISTIDVLWAPGWSPQTLMSNSPGLAGRVVLSRSSK